MKKKCAATLMVSCLFICASIAQSASGFNVSYGFMHYIDFGIFDGQQKLLMSFYDDYKGDDAEFITYAVLLSSSEEVSKSDKAGDITTVVVKKGDMLTYDIDLLKKKEVFTTTYIVYPDRTKMGPEYGYLIAGNIEGTYNEGVPYSQASLNWEDEKKAIAKVYYMSGVRFYKLDEVILPMSRYEVADIVKNGRIDAGDINAVRKFSFASKE